MKSNSKILDDRTRSAGFTLTEMLVAVGLLMVIMVIFAEIFSLAVTAMTRQKGLANNDQRARTAFSIIDADLKRMSYRTIEKSHRPLRPNLTADLNGNSTPDYREGPATSALLNFAPHNGIVPLVPRVLFDGLSAANEQQGYIYYSENNPNDPTDDVLQFTINTELVEKANAYPGMRRYAGQRVEELYGRGVNSPPSPAAPITPNPRDQPDWDDGIPGNDFSSSTKAEVAYFLRNGNLYRRVVLLREDAGTMSADMRRFDGTDKKLVGQPAAIGSSGGNLYPRDLMQYYPGTRNFYTDFDFSAHFGPSPYNDVNAALEPLFGGRPSGAADVSGAVFHSSLSNDFTSNNWPLGLPYYRFGFSNLNGRSREFITDGTSTAFMGRYTHEETSNSAFGYPQRTSDNVYGRTDFNIAAFQATGRVQRYLNESPTSRRGADLLMSHVHAFDVEIWDETFNGGIGGFVDIDLSYARDFGSANGTVQHIHENDAWGPTNGSGLNSKNVFDTWHSMPSFHSEFPGALGHNLPPNAPIWIYPKTTFNDAPSVSTGYGIDVPYTERWSSGDTLIEGMLVFPSSARSPGTAQMGDFVVWEAVADADFTPSGSETLGATEPDWNVGTADNGGVDIFDQTLVPDPNDYDSPPDPSNDPDFYWRPHDNRKPIKAIRITILVRDPTSDQMRQVTLVHSFNESR